MSYLGGQLEFTDYKSLVEVLVPSHSQDSRYCMKFIFSYTRLNIGLEMWGWCHFYKVRCLKSWLLVCKIHSSIVLQFIKLLTFQLPFYLFWWRFQLVDYVLVSSYVNPYLSCLYCWRENRSSLAVKCAVCFYPSNLPKYVQLHITSVSSAAGHS